MPFGPAPLLQTWTFSSRALLAPAAPTGEQVFDLAPIAPLQILPRTWAWNYNLNLIGKDQLPVGETVSDLAPRAYLEPATRTWAFAFNLNLIGKDRFPPGTEFFDLTPKPYEFSNLFRTWSWSRNLNLIAQDAMIISEQVYDLPPIGLPYPISLRTWIDFFPLTLIPAAAPFNQDDWPLPGRYTPIQQSWAFSLITTTLLPLPYGYQLYDLAPRTHPEPRIRLWTWNYNLNLIGQDVLTVGEQVSDLVPRPYPEPATRTWTWWYNLNLIAKDRLLIGKQSYDLTPIAPLQILPRSWTWNYNLNLIGQDVVPGKQTSDLTPIAPPQTLPRSWTWSYNLNLVGQDQLPVGDQRLDLAPVGPAYSVQLRSWLYFTTPPPPPFAIPFNQFDWPNPKPYPEPATRTWAASYNLNLIGQDRMTVGEQVYDLTPIAQPQILPRSWTQNLLLSTLLTPIGDQWWERSPLGPIQPLREWAWRYNLNLVGQDVLPTGKQVSDLTPIGYIYPAQLRTWIDQYHLALNFVAGTPPPNQYDWPNPKAPLQPDRFYSASFPLILRGQDAMLVGKQVYDLAPRPYAEPATRTWAFSLFLALGQQAPIGKQIFDLSTPLPPSSIQLRSWSWSYNLNLRGQDVLPTGDQSYDLSPRDFQRLGQLRVWYERFNLNLIGQDKLPVGDQYYEFPRPPLQPTSIFVATYNKNLVGKDQLPTGDQYFDVSPRGPITPRDIINWVSSVNLALNFPAPPPVPLPPGALVYDLAPTDRRYSNFRDFISGCNLCIGIPITPPIPPPTPPSGPQFVHNPGNEWQIYDRIREPGPLGWR